ncbi:hypothetical protein HKD37_U058136 [Glycine soja]
MVMNIGIFHPSDDSVVPTVTLPFRPPRTKTLAIVLTTTTYPISCPLEWCRDLASVKRNLDQLEDLLNKVKLKTISTEPPSASIAGTRFCSCCVTICGSLCKGILFLKSF